MGSNTITPPPVLNRNSSDDEILGLLPQAPRRTARREVNGEGTIRARRIRERGRTNNWLWILAMRKFSGAHAELPQRTRQLRA